MLTALLRRFVLVLILIGAGCCTEQDAIGENPFLPDDVTDSGWAHIRGRNFSGHSPETQLADHWPAEGPPVLWVKDLGQGYSSIVVQEDRAYTQYQTLAGQFVICMNATSGKTIWEYRYDWPFEASGLYPGPRSTPTIATDHVFFATPDGSVGCLTKTGKLVWQQDLKNDLNGKGTDFGYACAPTVVSGKVIMPVGGHGAAMVALNAKDGKILWRAGDSSASYTPALPISVDGHQQVVGYFEHDLAAFDLETGRLLWREELSKGYDEHSAWPIYRDPHLWTSAPFQSGSQLLRLSAGDNASFGRVWQSTQMSNDVSSAVLIDEHLYGFDLAEAQSKAHRPSRGVFRCIDFLSGEPTWANGDSKTRPSTDYDANASAQTIGHANVITADGKLILFNDLGDLILARADPTQYVELARCPLLKGEICWTTPALDRGRIFVRNHQRAICVYIGNPDLIDRVAPQDRMTISDVPQSDVVDLSSVLGVEPEYAMDPPTYRWLDRWLMAALAILGSAGVLAAVYGFFVRKPNRIRWVFWTAAMLLGLVVGTPVSLMTRDFVFTWPVVIFAALHIAIYQCTLRRQPGVSKTQWQDRVVAVAFLAVCVAYFLICRRLSLVTEWTFLCGFAGAAPVLLMARFCKNRKHRWSLIGEFVLTLIAYAAFHVSTVLLLEWKYDLQTF